MTVVCVPDAQSVQLLGTLPDGVEVVVWNGEADHPDRLGETVFWVPQVEDSTDLDRKLAAMPDLKVMQLLSAGVEDVVGQIPDGVALCDARGVHGGPVGELVAHADPRDLPADPALRARAGAQDVGPRRG